MLRRLFSDRRARFITTTTELLDALVESLERFGTSERQRDRLREELTLVEIDRHGSKVEEFDVEGILNFAERVLPRASDLWTQASLEERGEASAIDFFRKAWPSAENHSIEPS